MSSYLPVKTEKASDKAPLRIYVDALKGSDRMITELVYWDSSRSALVAPFFNPKTESNDKTLRHEQLRCADINNDGVIEIPVQQQLLGEKRKVQDPDYENVFLTRWVSYTDGSLKTAVQAIVNADDGIWSLSRITRPSISVQDIIPPPPASSSMMRRARAITSCSRCCGSPPNAGAAGSSPHISRP